MLCPHCGKMMLSDLGYFFCQNCNFFHKIDSDKLQFQTNRTEHKIPILEPHFTKLQCPNCGNNVAYKGPQRIPNVDIESIEVGYLVECQKCGTKWFYHHK
jgi:DNA-directed RNA polymerase subunit RPC12/RpoP